MAVKKAAASKKPVTKSVASKKPAAKAKPTTKAKTSSAKKTAAAKAATKKAATKKAIAIKPSIRRPDPNQPPNANTIIAMTNDILNLVNSLEQYAANLRALDRQRHNGVGLRRLGFIEAALRLSSMFPQYFPHWLDTQKFQRDLDLFNAIRSLVEACRSLEEKAWNINVEASDMIYTDALEYYSQVKDAAKRRIDSAESIYTELHDFFRRSSSANEMEGATPSQKKIKRDVNALLHGKKDGEVIIKNVKPKITGGKHEVIDETFNDSVAFKETEEGSIKD